MHPLQGGSLGLVLLTGTQGAGCVWLHLILEKACTLCRKGRDLPKKCHVCFCYATGGAAPAAGHYRLPNPMG